MYLVLLNEMKYLTLLTSAGKLWTRSQKLAYTLLNKLSTRNEPLLVPGDRVSHDMKLCLMVVVCMLHSFLHFTKAPKMLFSNNNFQTYQYKQRSTVKYAKSGTIVKYQDCISLKNKVVLKMKLGKRRKKKSWWLVLALKLRKSVIMKPAYFKSWCFWLFPFRRLYYSTHVSCFYDRNNITPSLLVKGSKCCGFRLWSRYLLHTRPFTSNKNHEACHTLTCHVSDTPAGCTCFPQQRPSDVHGGLLRLPPSRVGTCAYWSATHQKGKRKCKYMYGDF